MTRVVLRNGIVVERERNAVSIEARDATIVLTVGLALDLMAALSEVTAG